MNDTAIEILVKPKKYFYNYITNNVSEMHHLGLSSAYILNRVDTSGCSHGNRIYSYRQTAINVSNDPRLVWRKVKKFEFLGGTVLGEGETW